MLKPLTEAETVLPTGSTCAAAHFAFLYNCLPFAHEMSVVD